MSYNLPNQIIDASGNKLGVGTTAPEYRLDVRSSGTNSQVFAVQGTQGRLLSVDDNLSSGTLFSVSNITGLPSFEVNASGDVELAEFGNSITAHKPILISGGVPVNTANKLYNDNGVLKFNGGSIAAGGTGSGVAFFDDNGSLTSSSDFTFASGSVFGRLDVGRPVYVDSPNASFLMTLKYNGSEKFRFNFSQFYSNVGGQGASLGTSSNYWGSTFVRNTSIKAHNTTDIALQVRPNAAGQSANLTEWQDVNEIPLASVTNSGHLETVEGVRIYGSGNPGGTGKFLSIRPDSTAGNWYAYQIRDQNGSPVTGNQDFYYGSNKVMTITGQIYAWKDLVPTSNNSKKLGDYRRWSEVNTADIDISGVTTFYKDVNTQTDVFYSGNSLVMELPNQNFEIRGIDGNTYIDFADGGNGAINVRTSLYPNGNKQTLLGYPTLRWEAFYGGKIDIETYNVAEPTAQIRAINSQTADLTQWQDPSSNVLAYVDKDGHAHFPSLSVSGDFTYVNSENVTIFDKQIELASLSGSAVSGDALVDEGGFVLKSTDGDKQFIWRDYDDSWTSNQNISLTSGNSIYFYSSGVGNTDYERLKIKSSAGSAYDIKAETLNGSLRPINIDSNQVNIKYQSLNRLRVGSSNILSYTNLLPDSDGSASLGLTSQRWNGVSAKSINAEAGSATLVPSTFKGASSQSANLTEWQDSAGDVLTKVTSDGSVHVSGVIASESDGEIRSYILGKPGDTDTEYLKIGDIAGSQHDIQPKSTGSGQNRHLRLASADGRGRLNLYSDGHLNYFFNQTQTFSAFHWGISVSGEIRRIGNETSLGQATAPFYAGYLNDVYTSGVTTSGIYINDNVPTSTTNQLYNDAGALKWNGATLSTGTVTGNPSGVAFFGDDSGLTNVGKLVYASGDDGDNLEHGYHLYKSGAGTANWERAEIGWGRTGGNATNLFYIGLNEGGTGSNSRDMRIAARQIDFKVGTSKSASSLTLATSQIVTHLRVVPGSANNIGDTLGHTTVPYGRLFLGDLDGSLRFNNDTYIGRPASGVLVVTSGTAYDNAIFRAGRFEAEGAHTDVTPLEVKGAISQTANLTEWKDGTGDTLATVESDGALYSAGTITASGQFIKFKHSTNESLDVWFGHNSSGGTSAAARIYANYMIFRGGSHGVAFNGSSVYGGVTASAGHKIGFASSAVTNSAASPDAAIARTAKGHIRIIDHNSSSSENLGQLTASGVNVSGIFLADNVPNLPNSGTHYHIYNSGGTLTWDGAFAAQTKSFLIDHPTREDMKLQYACLEGPENGAYVRGATTAEVIELPDYWTGLVDEESITVQLTPKSHKQDTYVSGIIDNKVYLISDTDIDVYYNVYGTRKDVAPLEVEW